VVNVFDRDLGHNALNDAAGRLKRSISIAPAYDAGVAVREVKICE
jgi:hypothetical protein